MENRSVRCTSTVGLGAAGGAILLALTSTAAVGQDDSGALQEIVVYAQRVEGTLQDTPISLAVFDADALRAIGAVAAGDAAAYTPNVQIDRTPLSRSAYSVSIRGIRSADPSLALDPTVGVYLDGVYLGRQSGSAFEIVDLERVEILRGPQGTLYGRNSTGGAINIITSKPSGEFGFVQQLTYGEHGYLRTQTSIDAPRLGNLAAKFSFNHSEHDGTVKSLYTDDELGGYNANSGRLSLRWTPTAALTVDYAFDMSKEDSNTSIDQITAVRDFQASLGGDFYAQMQAAAAAGRQSHLPYPVDGNVQPFEMSGHGLILDWDVGGVTLKSISSYREWDRTATSANFGTFRVSADSVLEGTTGTYIPAGELVANYTNPETYSRQEQWSQEFQLIGKIEPLGLRYTAGLYYFRERSREIDPQTFVFPALLAFGELPGAFQDFLCAGTCFGKSVRLSTPDFAYTADSEAFAAYGQVTWAVTERFDTTVGLRFTHDKKESTLTNDFADVGLATAVGSKSWDNVSPALTLNYEWSDDVSTYFTATRGYRSGGFNVRATNTAAFREPFDEENVTSYELGLKSEWLNRRLRLNGALFHYKYTDKQVAQFEAGSGGASSKIVNAGRANATGIEIDLTAMPIDDLLLTLSYGYIDMEYDSFVTGVQDPATGFPVFDADGEALVADISSTAATNVASPKSSASLRAEYTLARTALGDFVVHVDGSYVGARTFQEQLNAFDSSDSYSLWNARLALNDIPVGSGSLNASIWGRNLGNKKVREYGIDFGALGFATNTFKELRAVGIDLLYRY